MKEAYLEELESNVPVSEKSMIKIALKAHVDPLISNILTSGVPEINEEMLIGVRPKNFSLGLLRATESLLLLHGYCAGTK